MGRSDPSRSGREGVSGTGVHSYSVVTTAAARGGYGQQCAARASAERQRKSSVIRTRTWCDFKLRYFECGVPKYGNSFSTSVWGLRPVGGHSFFVRKAMR